MDVHVILNACRIAAPAVLAASTSVVIALPPVLTGRPATVVFAPWISSGEAIARATVGAKLLAQGRLPFVVTVIPERAN